jgi:hypothetical protein
VVKVEYESHSTIVDIASPFLFFIPHAQLERAENIAVDRYIMSHQWQSFMDEIQEEWNQTSLLVSFPCHLRSRVRISAFSTTLLGDNYSDSQLRISGNSHIPGPESNHAQFP